MKKNLLICICIFTICEIASAQSQVLWGMTPYGGLYNGGTIYNVSNSGTGFNVLHHFQSPAGFTPMGDLLQASNGMLYGTCYNGGSFFSCTIFMFDPTTNIYTDVYDFDIVHGDFPKSGVIEAPNGKLYGVASSGGVGVGYGVLYSLNMSTNLYTDEFTFMQATGVTPFGSPVLINGILYGLTTSGGVYNTHGVLYSYNISTNTYTDLFDFNGTLGSNPEGSLIQAGNGKLYGMTKSGGTYNDGVIFSYDLATGVYSKLFDFDGTNGSAPLSSLMQAGNGLLYGVTSVGGVSNYGVIFSFDPVTNTYVKLADFTGGNGSQPASSLMQGSNGNLYGTTQYGGANIKGTMFSFDISSNAITDLFDFTAATGNGSNGGFIVVTTTGITQLTGINGQLSVYPNPAKDKITVSIDVEGGKQVEISLLNTLGEKLYSFNGPAVSSVYRQPIDISNFKTGVYFLECIIDGSKTVTKLSKE